MHTAGQLSHPNALSWTKPPSCTKAKLKVQLVWCPFTLHTAGPLLSCHFCAPHPLKPDIFSFWDNFLCPQLLTHSLSV